MPGFFMPASSGPIPKLQQHTRDGGRHHRDQRAAEHGPQANAGKVVPALGRQRADAADLDAHGHEVAKASQGEGGQGKSLVREDAGHVAELDEGQELAEKEFHAEQLPQGQGFGAIGADEPGQG